MLMPLRKSDLLKQLSREQLSGVISAIGAELGGDCGSPAGANRKAVVKGTSCSLDTRQEAECHEAVAFNRPHRSVSREHNSFNGLRLEPPSSRSPTAASQTCPPLRARRERMETEGEGFHTAVSSREASMTQDHQNNVAQLIPKSSSGGPRVSLSLGQVVFLLENNAADINNSYLQTKLICQSIFTAASEVRGR